MFVMRGLLTATALLISSELALCGVSPYKEVATMDFCLESYIWKNRVLLIFAGSSASDHYKSQMQELESQTAGLLDRDLIVIEVLEKGGSRFGDVSLSEQSSFQLRHRLQVEPDRFQVILIGKDGTVKLRSSEIVPVSELFGLIDSMPMRQEEMGRKQNH
jgi:hypothetical protein